MLKIVDWLASKAGARQEGPDKPFGEGVFYENRYRNTQSVSEFYDELERIEKLVNATKQTGKIYGDLKAQDVKKYKGMQQARRALGVLWKTRREVLSSKDMDGAKKKEIVDRIEMGAMNISRTILGKEPIKIPKEPLSLGK